MSSLSMSVQAITITYITPFIRTFFNSQLTNFHFVAPDINRPQFPILAEHTAYGFPDALVPKNKFS